MFNTILGEVLDIKTFAICLAVAFILGLAVGTGYIGFAALFTTIVSLFIVLLSTFNFGESKTEEKKLTIMIPEDIDYTSVFDQIFTKYTISHTLERSKTTNMGSLFELRYRVKLKKGINEKDFIDHLRVKNGNLKVILSQSLLEEEL